MRCKEYLLHDLNLYNIRNQLQTLDDIEYRDHDNDRVIHVLYVQHLNL
jgi:hypothetical protein